MQALQTYKAQHHCVGKALVAFALLIAPLVESGGLVNNGVAVHFIVDTDDRLRYLP